MATRRRRKPAEPWGDRRLGVVLALAFDAFGRRGRADANKIAAAAGVSPSTVRRWIRGPLPERRRAEIARLVLPPSSALEQEQRELSYARDALRDIYGLEATPVDEAWRRQGWLEPHLLAVVHIDRLGICVARIARADGDQKTLERMRAGGGVIIDQDIFPNRFAAQVAKGELLEQVAAWRVVLPHGTLPRGRTEAWLADAPRRRVSWFVDNAELKPPASRRRRTASSGRRRSSVSARGAAAGRKG